MKTVGILADLRRAHFNLAQSWTVGMPVGHDVRAVAGKVLFLAIGWAFLSTFWFFPEDWLRLVLMSIVIGGGVVSWMTAPLRPARAASVLLACAWIAVTGSVLNSESYQSPVVTGYLPVILLTLRLFGVNGAILLASTTLVVLLFGQQIFGFTAPDGWGLKYTSTQVVIIQLIFLAGTLAIFPRSAIPVRAPRQTKVDDGVDARRE